MTTFQGIAVVTQTLRLVVSEALRTTVPEARVTLDRPEESPAASKDQPRLNIYLVQVGIEPGMRNNDLPTRSTNGSLLATPMVPVTLRYLFSYFGPSAQAHLMLGAIEIALHESPELAPASIVQAVDQHPELPLQGSGLDTQKPPVRVVPATLSLETLSRFWSGFFQTPYTLSTVHDVTPVVLSSTLAAAAALPVGKPGVATGRVAPALDALAPVSYAPGTVVPVSGQGVGTGQYVGIDGRWSAIEAQPGGGLGFALPDAIAAGVRQARLGEPPAVGDAPLPIAGAAARTIDIRPDIQSLEFASEHVHVTVQPAVGPQQTVTLSLNPASSAPAATGTSVVLQTSVTAPATELVFPLPPPNPGTRRPAGSYLATITVDGVASELDYSAGQYSRPLVEIA
jgi:hypothetical protein